MDKSIKQIVGTYPSNARDMFLEIRGIILDVAKENNLGLVTETLKWSQPSYRTKQGSTIRLHWEPKLPDKFFIYFHCQTSLVATFREFFSNSFNFEGNRAIVLNLSDDLLFDYIEICILLALQYHRIKHLPLLGIEIKQ